MEELIEGVLSIGTWFTEVDDTSFVRKFLSFNIDSLTVAFHIELLNVGSELRESLSIWQNGLGVISLNRDMIETDQTEHKRNILGDILGFSEVVVNAVGTVKELLHIVKSEVERKREDTNGTADTVTSTNPIPESKDFVF